MELGCDNTSCNVRECQAHAHVMSLITETREANKNLEKGIHDLKEAIIMLTHNQEELRRLNARWDIMFNKLEAKNLSQDTEIMKNTMFVNKAMGVVGAISFLAFIVSAVSAIFVYFLSPD